MTSRQTCVCCRSREHVPHLKGLRRCLQCAHVWADMEVSDEEFRELYSEKYFHGAEYMDYEKERSALCWNFKSRIRELRKCHPDGGKLFEIGSAYGFFLEVAKEFFQVTGCDISGHAARYAREKFGLDVQEAEYLSIPARENEYDIICMWDTIEHLGAPDLYIEKAAIEIKKGGTLAISTGDISSLYARIWGRKWRLIHPPTHLHYFTPKSLGTLFKRMGFVEIKISHPPFWRSLDATVRYLFSYPSGKWTDKIYATLKSAHLLNFNFPMNAWDIMTVYAKRSD